MSFFCSIDKSTVGTNVYKTARQFLTPRYSAESARYPNCRMRELYRPRPWDSSMTSPIELRSWFVTALVEASQCREHAGGSSAVSSLRSWSQTRRSSFKQHTGQSVAISKRYQHTKTSGSPSTDPLTKEALLALVDQYDSVSLTGYLPLNAVPKLRQLGSESAFSDSGEQEASEWPSEKYTWPAQGEHQKTVELLKKTLEDSIHDPDYVFWLYKALPAPRVPYLSASHRHMLLRVLAVLERKDEHSMLRYLSVVDDMKACSIALNTAEWNNVMSFAGRYVAKTTETEVESTLRLWKEMEHVAGIQSNSASFNILFDVATKAGKFKLGEMIYREMENRGLAFNRYHHVSLIHYYGLKGDGQGVRKAYKTLVESGEIVDTVVLNCMISSLFRSGEPQAAEQVYARMKILHSKRTPKQIPAKDYKKRREVNKVLVKMGQLARRYPAVRLGLQNKAIIAPDVQTYRILIQYLAVRAGDLRKATELLDEMRWFEVSLDGSIFLSLFKGFASHGGIRYSDWTDERLESVWRAYLQAVDSQCYDLYIGKWIIIWALRAFAKCSGNIRTVQIWDSIRTQWKYTEEELDHVTSTLRGLTEA